MTRPRVRLGKGSLPPVAKFCPANGKKWLVRFAQRQQTGFALANGGA